MRNGTRKYVNITNACDVMCPFCCMYSGPGGNQYISFDRFAWSVKGATEVQLEGGEPTLHPRLWLFMEYLDNIGASVTVMTNGRHLGNTLERIVDFSSRAALPVTMKVSVNDYLEKLAGAGYIEGLQDLHLATEFIPNFNLLLNVRGDSEKWNKRLCDAGLRDISNIYGLHGYGRYTGKAPGPFIVQEIENWSVVSSDGIDFGMDLVGRSLHEKGLICGH